MSSHPLLQTYLGTHVCLRYDQSGTARAFGAEATATRIQNLAEDESWQLAEHFKLHLHPITMRAEHNIIVQPLPEGIPIDRIYIDFFGYLLQHTQKFFESREINGADIWSRLSPSMEFVIAHPNGWSLHEQSFLRNAAVGAGFVPSQAAAERIHVVSEGEASVHFTMVHADMENRLAVRAQFFYWLRSRIERTLVGRRQLYRLRRWGVDL